MLLRCFPPPSSVLRTGALLQGGRRGSRPTYPLPPIPSLFSISTYFLRPHQLSLQPSFFVCEPAGLGGGVRVHQKRICWKLQTEIAPNKPPQQHNVSLAECVQVSSTQVALLSVPVSPSAPSVRVSPAAMCHVDTPVPDSYILHLPLTAQSIGLGHGFCMCLQLVSYFNLLNKAQFHFV